MEVVVCIERGAFKMNKTRRYAFRPLYTDYHFHKLFWNRKVFAKMLLMQRYEGESKHCPERARYYEYDLDIEIKSKPQEYRTM